MDYQTKCERESVPTPGKLRKGWNASSRLEPGLYDKVIEALDEDEFLISPNTYLKNRRLYDKIIDSGYIYEYTQRSNDGIYWVWNKDLRRLLKTEDVNLLSKNLVVRRRLPWYDVGYEWLCSKSELEKHRIDMDDIEVLETMIYGKDLDSTDGVDVPYLIESGKYELNPNRYEVTEVKYLVTWRMSDKERAEIRTWGNDAGIKNDYEMVLVE